ncbi:MAG: hypothetical protein IJ167_11890, partial [Lachnospiraceae bacterium]|nr:hypothetical protein [Lachnospiraceae bacterium]
NNILNVRTIPMEMEYTPARSTTQDMLVYDDGIGKIYMNSMSLYDSNMDGVPELYYLWDFSDLNYFEFEDGSVEQCVNNYYRVVTRYSYDGIRVNYDSVSYVYEYLNGKSEVQIVDATGDISLTDIVIDKNPNVFEKGIDVYKENEDGTSADIDKVNYYIANYKRETKAEIDDSLPWRQAYIDYLKSLDLTDPSMYIEDEIFNIINESFFWCDFATYEFKLVDYDNNGIPELCLMKWWNGFELSGSIYQYEFVEYKEDGNLEIIHAAELYEYNSLDGECFVKTRGDKERLDHSLIDLFDEEGFSDSWYPLINNAPEYEFEYYFYDSTTSDLNPDAITYIENYGK